MDLDFLFPANTEVGALMRAHDWSQSPLQTPDTWPQALKTLTRLVLDSKLPMFIAWGPELRLFYNDAYTAILGAKHPQALGAPFEKIWREVWPDVSPIVDKALSGQSSFHEDLPLLIDRGGHLEQAWFTFTYVPLHDDKGVINGLYCSAVETTRTAREQALRHFQLQLADALHSSPNCETIITRAVKLLANHLGASGCWYSAIEADTGVFHTKSGWFSPGSPALTVSGKIEDFGAELLSCLRAGEMFISNDITADPRLSRHAHQFEALDIRSILIVPAIKDNRLTFNVNVANRNAYTWTPENIQAALDVVNRTWAAIENCAAQEHLQIERGRSDHILSQMAEGFMVVGADGRVEKINAAGLRMLQRHETDVVAKCYSEVWPDELGRSNIPAAFEQALNSNAAVTIDLSVNNAGFGGAWWEMRASALENKGIAVFFRDITPQKQAALALSRSEAHMAALFEQTSAAITERNLKGQLTRVNERFCRLLGRSREALLQMSIGDLTYPEDRHKSDAAFKKLLEDRQPFEIEKRYVKPDGTLIWVSTTVSFIDRSDTHLQESVLAVVLDITERKRAEEALEAETRILERLNASGQSLASTLNLNTLLQTATDTGKELINAAFGAFFYNTKDETGESMTLYTLSGAPREAFDGLGHPRATPVFKGTFLGEPPIRSDDITQDSRYGHMAPHHGMPTGHPPVKSYLATSVVSHSGEVLGGLFFGHPEAAVFTERSERLITGLAAQAAMAIDNARLYDQAQKAAQERQGLLASERAARAEGERLNRLKDEFLAMLAHELRNPLAPVSAAADILRLNGRDAQKVKQVSEIISRQISHFTRLIDDLMDVSRVTRGLIQLDIEPLDLATVVSTAIEQVQPMIKARNHNLMTQIDITHARINGDRTRLVQAIANLLTNAAKYTPAQGEIALKVFTESNRLSVEISDNGNGVDVALLPHIFDLFTQGARGLDRTQGGLGIGLALVKAIVTLHQGEIQARSLGLGCGSTFSFSIPLMDDPTQPHEEQALGIESPSPLAILIVDDNVDAAEALSILLSTLGYGVQVAATAAEAISKVQSMPPDVFILDIGLPDMTGYELAKTLRQSNALSAKTYFALTGYSQPQDRELSKEAGFTQHFVKPVTSQQLLKALAEISPSKVSNT